MREFIGNEQVHVDMRQVEKSLSREMGNNSSGDNRWQIQRVAMEGSQRKPTEFPKAMA